MNFSYDSDSSGGYAASEDFQPWVERFCEQHGHGLLLAVPLDFFTDFNLYGLSHQLGEENYN